MTARPRRWLFLAFAPLLCAAVLTVPAPANAAPNPNPNPTGATAPNEDGNEKTPLLNDVLESGNRRYVQAKAAVAKSTTTQAQLAVSIKAAEAKRNVLLPEVNAIAAQQYRTGKLNTMSFLLNASSSADFLGKATSLGEIGVLHDHKLRDLNAAIAEVATQKARLDAEVQAQQLNLAAMKKQKESAEQALALVGGSSLTQGFVVASSPVAAPAPRNSDGGFSPEKCDQNDPTTDGCVTKRTLHLYQEVKKAGFDRFVGCHRYGGPYEHPKGRACDWSLQNSGFSEAHNADMKSYGNNLMAFLVRNAERLGVYYIIWYEQIWFPATNNWHAYHGDSNHKDHVHVSLL